MKKGIGMNRREFIGGSTAGMAALAGMELAGDAAPATAQTAVAVDMRPEAILERRKQYLKTLQVSFPEPPSTN